MIKKILITIIAVASAISLIIIIHHITNDPELKAEREAKNTSETAAKMSRTLILDQVRPYTPNPTTSFDPSAYHAAQQPDGTWTTKGQVTYTDHSGRTHTKPYLITYHPDLSIKTYAFNGTIQNYESEIKN